MDTRHLGQAWGFSFGFHTFVACHVTRLPLTTYQLPLAICHFPPHPPASPARTSTRPYPFPLPFRTRRHFFQFARSVRNVCHNGLSNDNVPRGGYYIQQAEWLKDAWLPGWLPDCLADCLAARLYSISIGACFKSIFIIIFISFYSRFSIFPILFPLALLLHSLLALFVHSALSSHHAGSLSAAFVAQCSTEVLCR